ncbi:MAG: N-6 DNA methylase [Terriglobales bacterium]
MSSGSHRAEGESYEILFIEQCWHYLAEGGYLAIVIPDSILTNSSLQYVHDEIEEIFRIVAVVSLPQTAFTATGAGVKSSILFLKKYTDKETKRMRDTKQALKDSILKQEKFEVQLVEIERRRKKAIADLNDRPEFSMLNTNERKDNPAHAAAAKQVSEKFSTQLEDLRYRLAEIFEVRRRKDLPDYEIFMAEDIGYDATGPSLLVVLHS